MDCKQPRQMADVSPGPHEGIHQYRVIALGFVYQLRGLLRRACHEQFPKKSCLQYIVIKTDNSLRILSVISIYKFIPFALSNFN